MSGLNQADLRLKTLCDFPAAVSTLEPHALNGLKDTFGVAFLHSGPHLPRANQHCLWCRFSIDLTSSALQQLSALSEYRSLRSYLVSVISASCRD